MIRRSADKLLLGQKLPQTLDSLREQGKKIVTTNGCFDLLHLGHFEYLKQARELGDVLIVLLNSNASVKSLKGESRPINDEAVRALQLAALEAVDYVTVFGEDTPETILKFIKPQIHVKGGDYKPEQLKEKAVVEEHGGEIKILPFVPGYSTTDLIEKLKTI